MMEFFSGSFWRGVSEAWAMRFEAKGVMACMALNARPDRLSDHAYGECDTNVLWDYGKKVMERWVGRQAGSARGY